MGDFKLLLPDEEEALRRAQIGANEATRLAQAGVDEETISTIREEKQVFVKRIGDLTPEEQRAVDDCAKSINIHSPEMATKYALGSQSKLNSLADQSLRGVAGKDVGDVGELLANMSIAMTTFNKDFNHELERGKSRRLFGRAKMNLAESKERIRVKYDDVLKTLSRIAGSLEKRHAELEKDAAMQSKLYDSILNYYKELSLYVLAAKKALNNVVNGELVELKQIADETQLAEDAQAFQKCQDDCSKFEKRIYSLELTRAICIQSMPQIRIMQMSNNDIMQQIVDTLNNSIPLWKQGIATGLSLAHSESAVNALSTMRNLTSEMLKKNAEILGVVGTEAARQSEEGYIDPEAIVACNQILIKTLGDISEIHRKGLEKRNSMRTVLRENEEALANMLRQPYTDNLTDWSVVA